MGLQQQILKSKLVSRSNLAYAAVGEPESVCVEALPISIESHQSLLDKLLRAAGSEAKWEAAQS